MNNYNERNYTAAYVGHHVCVSAAIKSSMYNIEEYEHSVKNNTTYKTDDQNAILSTEMHTSKNGT
jgi:hypothetical protein